MSNSECLQKFTKNLFWDVDTKDLSMDKHPSYIIQRTLEYRQMDDWRIIWHYYGLDKIVEECKKMRTLAPVCLSFICTISHQKGGLQMLSFQTVFPDTLELLMMPNHN